MRICKKSCQPCDTLRGDSIDEYALSVERMCEHMSINRKRRKLRVREAKARGLDVSPCKDAGDANPLKSKSWVDCMPKPKLRRMDGHRARPTSFLECRRGEINPDDMRVTKTTHQCHSGSHYTVDKTRRMATIEAWIQLCVRTMDDMGELASVDAMRARAVQAMMS